MPSWLDLLMGGQAPVMAPPPGQQPGSPPFVPQQMAVAPIFAQAPQMAQDVAAGIAAPVLNAGNYLGGLMQGSQQFNWPDVVQHGAALAMAMAPGPKGERVAGAVERGLARAAETPILQPSGLPVQGPAFSKAASQALSEVQALPKGAGPMDLTGELKGQVPQTTLERYNPPRGVSPRLQDALNNPDVVNGVSEGIQRGIDMGAHQWYHTEPIRKAFADAYRGSNSDPGGAKAFANFMDMVAATSPRSDVPTNIRNASYYFGLAQRGEPLPAEIPYPYGHVAQNLHRRNFADLTAAGDLSAGTTPGFNVLRNPKPASFSQNLQGNLEPVTADTHAFRAIGMRTGDPRFLETSLTGIVKGEQDPAKQTLINKYGDISTNAKGEKIVTFRPQQLYNDGRLTMDEAKNIPMFWASKPNPNEYAAVENFYRDLAAKHGIAPADAQAAGWAGSGELTGLGTVPDKTFAQMMNERALYTAKVRGEDPQQTLLQALLGQKPLLATGGAIPLAAAPYFAPQRQDQQQ